MAFPQVAAEQADAEILATLTHVISVPPGAGRIVLLFAYNSNPVVTGPGGAWTVLVPAEANGTNAGFAAWELITDGSHLSTVTVLTDSLQRSESYSLLITGAHASTPSAIGTVFSGTSLNPNPPACNPAAWDVEDTLWLAFGACDTSSSASISATAAPANFTNLLSQNTSQLTSGVLLYLARREQAVASQDPGTFTISASEQNVLVTIGIRPGTASEDHSGTATLTGGGVVVPIAAKMGETSQTATGGGVLVVTAAKTASVSTIATGGGVLVAAVSTDRQLTAVLTGGGVIVPEASTARSGADVSTGGGALVVTQETARESTATATGGGEVTIQYSLENVVLAEVSLTGSGVLATSASAARTRDAALTGGGTLIWVAATARAATAALTGGGVLTVAGGPPTLEELIARFFTADPPAVAEIRAAAQGSGINTVYSRPLVTSRRLVIVTRDGVTTTRVERVIRGVQSMFGLGGA